MVRHDARGIQLVCSTRVMQNSLKRDVALGRRKFPVLPRRKRDHVFCPRALEMRKPTLVVRWAWSFRCRRSGPRGARAPQNARHLAVEKLDASVERLVKPFFFASNCFFDRFFLRTDFGKDVTHCLRDYLNELKEEWFLKAKSAPVTHGTTKNTASNVTAAFVGWGD